MFIAWALFLTAIWADLYFKRFPDPPQKPQSDDGRAAADSNPTVEEEVKEEDSDVPAAPPKPLVNPRLVSWFFFITQFVVTVLAMAVEAIDYSNDCAESAIPGLSAEDVAYAWSVPCLARHTDLPFISPDVVPSRIAIHLGQCRILTTRDLAFFTTPQGGFLHRAGHHTFACSMLQDWCCAPRSVIGEQGCKVHTLRHLLPGYGVDLALWNRHHHFYAAKF